MTPAVPDGLSDEALVTRIRNGDKLLFELLVRRHNQRLYRVTRSILRDDHDAEDAVQDAYVAAYLRLDSFEGRSKFATWVTRIAVRVALTRNRQRREVHRSVEEAMTDPGRTPEKAAADSEIGRLIEVQIDTLPDTFRTVFMLRMVQELSTAETAQCLEIPEPTVKTRLFRAKKLLRDRLGEQLERDSTKAHAFAGERCDRLTRAVMTRILEDS